LLTDSTEHCQYVVTEKIKMETKIASAVATLESAIAARLAARRSATEDKPEGNNKTAAHTEAKARVAAVVAHMANVAEIFENAAEYGVNTTAAMDTLKATIADVANAVEPLEDEPAETVTAAVERIENSVFQLYPKLV